MAEFVVWGGTGNYKVAREIVESHGHRVVALFDNNLGLSNPFPEIPFIGGRDALTGWLEQTGHKQLACVVTMGGKYGRDRLEIQRFLSDHGLLPEVLKHQSAYISPSATIGAGSQVYAMAAVCAAAIIGKACIINTAASVDHDCTIGDGVFIGPGAHLAGSIVVENFADIYTGATILPRVRIGEGAVVGAGAVVLKDVPANTVVAGNPARIIKKREYR